MIVEYVDRKGIHRRIKNIKEGMTKKEFQQTYQAHEILSYYEEHDSDPPKHSDVY